MNEKNDYDVKPENNMPRMVYGIPREDFRDYNVPPRNNVPAKVYGVKRVTNNNSSEINELKNICDMYKYVKSNNYQYVESLISIINKYTIKTVKDYEIDPFWSESARNILKIIIIIDLINYDEISEEKIIEQLKDIDELKKYLLDNAEKLANSEFKDVKMNTQTISSDKPFESAIQLIREAYEKN